MTIRVPAVLTVCVSFACLPTVCLAQGDQAPMVPVQVTQAEVDAGISSTVVMLIEEDAQPVQGRASAEPVALAESVLTEQARRGLVTGWRELFTGMSRPHASRRYYMVRLAEGVAPEAACHTLSGHAGVWAEPVATGRAQWIEEQDDEFTGPSDSMFTSQYALYNTGQRINTITGIPGADINMLEAWTLERGEDDLAAAVVDAGVSDTHPDLMAKLLPGWNVTDSGGLVDTDAPVNSHGTMIAGIIAANTNNAEGVAGIAWRSRVLPVRAANELGFTIDAWLAEGVVWAADNGAPAVVVSYGLSVPTTVLRDAVRYAYEQGVVVCASAGNSGQPGVFYPAKYPESFAVGGTNNSDQRLVFSSSGPEVDMVAPGQDILSTWHLTYEPHTYRMRSGTSFSAPMVAGAIVLLRSANPRLTPDDLKWILSATAKDLGNLGRDDVFGEGRINVGRALRYVLRQDWCPADVNGDGLVDSTDLTAWITAYNQQSPRADQNGDQLINANDLSSFIGNYTRGCTP